MRAKPAVRRAVPIVLLAGAVFWPVARYPFVAIDDPDYVSANPWVAGGLTRDGVAWAFGNLGYAGNWHPLAWLSHMLDAQWFGLDAGLHHLTSLVLHLAGTLLLFLALRAATGAPGRSAVVAALFSVHPLHVESVAWVSERKDVLSALFWMATIAAHLRYARAPRLATYLPVPACLALGLMAKPMLVTLPLVLLILDWWPLGRLRRLRGPVLLEKVPLLALAAVSAAVTLAAQSRGGAMAGASAYPPGHRLANAAVSAVSYLRKALWPSDLAFFYPHPLGAIPAWKWLGAALLLALATAAAAAMRRTRPALAAGWLWYCGTLVPVLGIVHAGGQAMADRYTYIPLVGVFLAAAWSGPRARCVTSRPRIATGLLACVIVLANAAMAAAQVRHWRDSAALAGQAIRVTAGNWMAHAVLGADSLSRGDYASAAAHYRDTIAANPGWVDAGEGLAVALTHLGRTGEAVARLEEVVRLRPERHTARNNLGYALMREGRVEEAIGQYRAALRLNPGSAQVRINLGSALLRARRPAEAQASIEAALRLSPAFADAHYNLAMAMEMQGDRGGAVAHYRAALRLAPADGQAREGLRRLGASP